MEENERPAEEEVLTYDFTLEPKTDDYALPTTPRFLKCVCLSMQERSGSGEWSRLQPYSFQQQTDFTPGRPSHFFMKKTMVRVLPRTNTPRTARLYYISHPDDPGEY